LSQGADAGEAGGTGGPSEGQEPQQVADAQTAARQMATEDAGPSEAAEAPPLIVASERSTAPVRFVWKTDNSGRFSEIGEDFVAVVGMAAANVMGLSFREAAGRLGIDLSGEIAGLLERHDTWSGRSVLWPVAGTDLRVPVDLAALPTYDRDRNFAGFRGFGIARTADAVVDPEAAGLALLTDASAE